MKKINIIDKNLYYSYDFYNLDNYIINGIGYYNKITPECLNIVILDDNIQDITEKILSYYPKNILDILKIIKFIS